MFPLQIDPVELCYARHPEELSENSKDLCNTIGGSVLRCSQPDGIVTGRLLGQAAPIGMSWSQVEWRDNISAGNIILVRGISACMINLGLCLA
jgi:hypothetical protein